MRPVALVLAVMFTAGMAATAGGTPAGDVKQVRAQGCIEPGVEAGCLVVKDIESGKLYHILVKGCDRKLEKGLSSQARRTRGQPLACRASRWT
jgi:adenine deaminase